MALAIAALSACAVVTGKYEPMSQVNNDTLNLPETSGQTLAQWPHEGWWRAYNDVTLNALVEQALADGPSLKVLAQRAQIAKTNADAVRKSHYPAGQIKATWTGFGSHSESSSTFVPSSPEANGLRSASGFESSSPRSASSANSSSRSDWFDSDTHRSRLHNVDYQ